MTLSVPLSRIGRLAAVIAFVVTTIAAGETATSGDGRIAPSHPGVRHHPMRPMRDNTGAMMRGARHEAQTTNWSGYFVAQYQTGQSYTSAQGTWTVPTSSFSGSGSRTSTTQYSATWVGIGGTCTDAQCSGNGDQTLIQLGTEQDASKFGGPDYYAWYEMLPADSVTIPYPVQPGDRITASLQCTASCSSANQTWSLSMTDYTQNWSWSQSFVYASSELSTEWIEEATSLCNNDGSNCTVEPLADFGTLSLGPGTTNGANPFLTLAQNGIEMNQNAGITAQPSSPYLGDNFASCWGDGSFTPCSFTPSTGSLVASVLPSSRSVKDGSTATAFATIINTGSTTASDCAVGLGTNIGGAFTYQTTNSSSNASTGSANTPIDVPAGGVQSFVLSLTPGTTFAATDIDLQFYCATAGMAPIDTGLDTLLLGSSATSTPDVVALSATPSGDGILDIQGTGGSAAFALATVNVGSAASGDLTVSAGTGSASLPLSFTLCQTSPSTGQCAATPAGSVSASFPAEATPTFSVFVQASGTVAFDPANNRIFVKISDSAGNIRGETSVAVRTR